MSHLSSQSRRWQRILEGMPLFVVVLLVCKSTLPIASSWLVPQRTIHRKQQNVHQNVVTELQLAKIIITRSSTRQTKGREALSQQRSSLSSLSSSSPQQQQQQQQQNSRKRRKRVVSLLENNFETNNPSILSPLQIYRNAMTNISEYESWLIRPIINITLDTTFNQTCSEQQQQQKQQKQQLHSHHGGGVLSSRLSFFQQKDENNTTTTPHNTKTVLDPQYCLRPIYIDSSIVVVDKPSGVLSVPGPRRMPSIANLVYDYFGPSTIQQQQSEMIMVDETVIHRLDMDTSGVLIFARTKDALKVLHQAFRQKLATHNNNNNNSKNQKNSGSGSSGRVQKRYEALVCGWLSVDEGEIDLPLCRDTERFPFMRVDLSSSSSSSSSRTNNDGGDDTAKSSKKNNNSNIKGKDEELNALTKAKHKLLNQSSKSSLTLFRVLSWERLGDTALPVTRLELTPITGRTHQLRVHCAAIGHPIVGDNIYGYNGEGSSNGGIALELMNDAFPHRATESLQHEIYQYSSSSSSSSALIMNDVPPPIMCLHARELCLYHPLTGAPMSFQSDAPF